MVSGPTKIDTKNEDGVVKLTPMSDDVIPPELIGQTTVVIKAYGLLPDGRSKSPLVPAHTSRDISTRLRAEFSPHMLPLVSTPRALHELNIQCFAYRIAEDGELFITLLSARHESVNLKHGDSIAVLHFVNMLMVDLKDGKK